MAAKINDILAYFDRTADQFLSREEFKAKLKSGKPLRIKYSVDVRTPMLHIGHAVNLWLMRYLQDRGHKVVFVIGDFTTRIGDPDGRLETHVALPEEDIERNIKDFLEQARMVLRFDDPALIEVRRNSEWWGEISMREFMDIASLVTHARLIARDMFQLRIAQNKEIYVQELLYPILQGYDSFVVQSDLAIVGSDQFFNESIGRLLQEKHKKKPQTLITTRITPGIDGKGKQSKSMGNYIGLKHSPRDKFGRIMSIPDYLIEEYLRIYTDIPFSEIDALKDMIRNRPRDAKLVLASALIERYHGAKAAAAEREWFENTFSKGQAPDDLPTLGLVTPRIEALDLVILARPGKSKSDSRRLIKQGGVELNGKKLSDPDRELLLKTNDILKIGKRNWFRIEIVEVADLETERLRLKAMQVADVDLVAKYLPQWEMVKYLGKFAPAAKVRAAMAKDVLKKIIQKPEPKHEWLWTVTSKDRPEEVIGVAHLRRDGREGHQQVWLGPGHVDEQGVLMEVLMAVNQHAFHTLGFSTTEFKDAFAYATMPPTVFALHQAMRNMNVDFLNRDEADASWGFTHEGWDAMQEWRRQQTPWLFENSLLKTALGRASRPENSPQPRPAPKPDDKRQEEPRQEKDKEKTRKPATLRRMLENDPFAPPKPGGTKK